MDLMNGSVTLDDFIEKSEIYLPLIIKDKYSFEITTENGNMYVFSDKHFAELQETLDSMKQLIKYFR